MTPAEWLVFASFWALFVTTPGPNAVNCLWVSLAHGFRPALCCVAGIMSQASLFLALSSTGLAALLVASPMAFAILQYAGAAILIALGFRAWMRAGSPVVNASTPAKGLLPSLPFWGAIFARAFAIATFNAKSVAGYLAAFSQFVSTDAPIAEQMGVIVPTALTLTALSYTGWCAVGAWLGTLALGLGASCRLRRVMALCFVLYGVGLFFL